MNNIKKFTLEERIYFYEGEVFRLMNRLTYCKRDELIAIQDKLAFSAKRLESLSLQKQQADMRKGKGA